MHPELKNLHDAVRNIFLALRANLDHDTSLSGNKKLSEVYGENYPKVSRDELYAMAENLANDIQKINIDPLPDSIKKEIQVLYKKLIYIPDRIVYSSQKPVGTEGCIHCLEETRNVLFPYLDWPLFQNPELLPSIVADKFSQLNVQIRSINSKKNEIEDELSEVRQTSSHVQSLLKEAEELKIVRQEMQKFLDEFKKFFEKIKKK